MKYLKWFVITVFLVVGSSSYSWEVSGWYCFHNGGFYTTVGANMACPVPDLVANSNGILYKHDPNDHTCVITREARTNY